MPSPRNDALRQLRAKPVAEALHTWMTGQRKLVPEGSAIAKALDYSLKRWEALTRYLEDGDVPVDNNWVENQIRPWAVGRANWLFAGSLRAGQRAAAIMSLIRSAQLNGHDPYAYLKDVVTRLPTQPIAPVTLLNCYHIAGSRLPVPSSRCDHHRRMWRNQSQKIAPRYSALHLVEEHAFARASVAQVQAKVGLFHALIVPGKHSPEHPDLCEF